MEKHITDKYKSASHYILASLIPYTEANIKLTFLPRRYFSDLAKIDKYKEQTLRNAYYRNVKRGLVELDDQGNPIITSKGLAALMPYRSKTIEGANLMITFDIPEFERYKRQQLRLLLRQLGFKQVQKSVWVTNKDSRGFIKDEIRRLNLEKEVKLFECKSL